MCALMEQGADELSNDWMTNLYLMALNNIAVYGKDEGGFYLLLE